ncbi:MAG: magnesium/cobalt transporter CorA [Deltaproteobacteria bacterium]|jgi:magnesium transporter|nr:magnesium/cobalt transporter CorA [Deltaproteobacteria bacterium]
MRRLLKSTSKKAGLSPGTLVHIGEKKAGTAQCSLFNYGPQKLEEKQLATIDEAFEYKDMPPVTWINIDGLHETSIIEKIGHQFDIHPLTLEDVVHAGQRAKAEDYEDYIFIVFKMLFYDDPGMHISSEQVSLILGAHFLISFQEKEGDVFNFVRERIRKVKGRIRRSGPDYLTYALIDASVDHYFSILEKVDEKLEQLEEELLDNPQPGTLQDIHHLKRELIYFRKQVWPLRELLNHLMHAESRLVQESSHIFFRDVYDHTIQVIDTIESLRDALNGLQDLYLSTMSHKMNEVMKVLTIMATIFIPLTFIAGIYGMNFKFMPELEWKWSYPILWGVLIAILAFMIFWFKRKRWL